MGGISLLALIAYALHLYPVRPLGSSVPAPDTGFITKLAGKFVIALVAGHIVLAILFRAEADEAEDERDWRVMFKAGAFSGSFLGFFIVGGLWHALAYGNSDILVHLAIIGLLLSSLLSSVLQTLFYRGVA